MQSLVVTDGTNSQELQNCDSLLFRSSYPIVAEVQTPNTVALSIEPGANNTVLTTNASGTVVWAAPGQTTGPSVSNNADGTYTHNDGFGNNSIIDTRALSNPFIPTGTSLNSTNVNSAIIEVFNRLHVPATISSPDSTVTAIVSGVDNQTFDLSVNIANLISGQANNNLAIGSDGKLFTTGGAGTGNTSILTDNSNGTYTHNDGAGNNTIIDANYVAQAQLTGSNLVLTKVDGTAITVPLNSLIDNTNLPRITSGVLTGNVIRLTRDDATFIDVDLTSILSELHAQASVTSLDGTVSIVASGVDNQTFDLSVNETNTTLTIAGNVLTYTNETGNGVDITLPSGSVGSVSSVTQSNTTGSLIATHSDGNGNSVGILETITGLALQGTTLVYTDENGTANNVVDILSIIPASNTSSITNALTTGSLIGVHNDGNGTAINLFESVTSLTINGNNLEFIDESGATNTVPLPAGSTGATLTEANCTLTFDDGNGSTLDFPVYRNVSQTIPTPVQGYTETRVKEVAIRHDATDCSLKGYVEKEYDTISTNIDLGALENGRVYPTQGNLAGTTATNYYKIQLLPPYTQTQLWGVKAHILEDNAGRTVPVVMEVRVNGAAQTGLTVTFGTGIDQQNLILTTPIVINDGDEVSIVVTSAPGTGDVGYNEIKLQHNLFNIDII